MVWQESSIGQGRGTKITLKTETLIFFGNDGKALLLFWIA